ARAFTKMEGGAGVQKRPRTGATRRGYPLKCEWRRLLAGHVVFEKVRMLQAGELDREAAFDMAHDAARHLADCHLAADLRNEIRCDQNRGTGLRQVDNAAGDIVAVRQDQPCQWIARGKAAVTAVFR